MKPNLFRHELNAFKTSTSHLTAPLSSTGRQRHTSPVGDTCTISRPNARATTTPSSRFSASHVIRLGGLRSRGARPSSHRSRRSLPRLESSPDRLNPPPRPRVDRFVRPNRSSTLTRPRSPSSSIRPRLEPLGARRPSSPAESSSARSVVIGVGAVARSVGIAATREMTTATRDDRADGCEIVGWRVMTQR